MKIVLTVLLVIVVGFFGLSLVSTVAALFVPSIHMTQFVGHGFVQPSGYNGLMWGGGVEQHLGPIIFFTVVALVAAIFLRRWRSNQHHGESRMTKDTSNGDLDTLARDLDRTARRLEERLEALETILLERSSHGR